MPFGVHEKGETLTKMHIITKPNLALEGVTLFKKGGGARAQPKD